MLLETLTILLNLDTKDAEVSIDKLRDSFYNLVRVGTKIVQAFGLKSLIDSFVGANSSVITLTNTLGEDYNTVRLWGEAVKTVGGDLRSFSSSLLNINSNIEQFAFITFSFTFLYANLHLSLCSLLQLL